MFEPVELADFLAQDVPRSEFALDPVLPLPGLLMLFAPRGVGKTHVSLGMSYAIASGGEIFGWRAPKPRRVLFVDGEMSAYDLQSRLKAIARNRLLPPPGYFRVVTPELVDGAMPDISTPQGQRLVDEQLDGVDVLVLDNLSTLCRSGDENEAGSWIAVQTWLVGLRAEGRSVVLVHHAGKSGEQRGTSKREDVLNTVLRLVRPDDYDPSQGARFVVRVDKGRSIHGHDAAPFEAQYHEGPEGVTWDKRSI